MLIALFQPDMAPNVGSIIRLSACLRLDLHIIEPCGFPFDDKRMHRVAMDYGTLASLTRHASWQAFLDWRIATKAGRLVLLTTKGTQPYYQFTFAANDILLLGQESAGAPAFVHAAADARVNVPVFAPARSLNLVQAASIVAAEALRQTGLFPAMEGV